MKEVRELLQFANIGKAILIQMLGLQKNYHEDVVGTQQVLDPQATGCASCPYYKQSTLLGIDCKEQCDNCPHRKYKEEPIIQRRYFNEFNQFGYKPMLKCFAIKLMLLFHFQSPDKDGYCLNFDPYQAAETLGCTTRTVLNNLDNLQRYKYIKYKRVSPHNYNILLTEYKNYFSPATKGGRGYFVMPQDLFKKILPLGEVNQLRIILRELLEFDKLSQRGNFTINNRSIEDIRKYLPFYCKPYVINKIIASLDTPIMTFEHINGTYRITSPYGNTKQFKEDEIEYWTSYWKVFVFNFNDNILFTNKEQGQANPLLFLFEDKGYHDIAMMTLQYGAEEIQKAMETLYYTYVVQNREVTNPGGLLRHLIEHMDEEPESNTA